MNAPDPDEDIARFLGDSGGKRPGGVAVPVPDRQTLARVDFDEDDEVEAVEYHPPARTPGAVAGCAFLASAAMGAAVIDAPMLLAVSLAGFALVAAAYASG